MKYIASISDNYPYKYYGEFISENDYDYLTFIEGKKIQDIIKFKIVYNISIKEVSKLHKWDILAVNRSFYLVNDKVKDVLKLLEVNSIEYLPANAITKDGFNIEGYYLLNILNDNEIYRDDETRIIYSERFVQEFKKQKLKGLIFYSLDEGCNVSD